MFEELLKQAAGAGEELEPYKTPSDAREALEKFVSQATEEFKVGEFIERNDCGRVKYKFPADNQAAIVTKIYPEYIPDGDGSLCNMSIMITASKEMFLSYMVDSRYYRKANANVKNIFSFTRK